MASLNPMKSNGKSHGPDIADVEAQLAKLSGDIAALTKTVAAYGGAKASEAGEQARSMTGTVADQARAMTDTLAEQARSMGAALAERSSTAAGVARERLVTAEGRVEDGIRANPLAAVGVAAGVGFLAALLAKR